MSGHKLMGKFDVIHFMTTRLILLSFPIIAAFGYAGAQGVPIDRIKLEIRDPRLETAENLMKSSDYAAAAQEIDKQLKADSVLLKETAIILGGNYHLQRITNNVLADRVGGFSPSGDKLAYARDTSLLRLDDGLFDWYENRTTGVFYYDFKSNEEITPNIADPNAFEPRFLNDSTLMYLIGSESSQAGAGNVICKYDLEPGKSSECFPMGSRGYCTLGDDIVVYDWQDGVFQEMNIKGEKKRELFDNDSFFSFKRPLPLIQNLSSCAEEIYFQSGYQFGKIGVNVYSFPASGGRPKIRTQQMLEYDSNGFFYPAAINENEFLYLAGAGQNVDIYYQKGNETYRFTYDGGDKYYLVVSQDGSTVAYSYMPEDQGVDSYEIFMLDFSRDATIDDIKYRINTIR